MELNLGGENCTVRHMKSIIKNHVSSFLEKKFRELNGVNPRFSQNSFAKKLKISSGSLSELLQGKRHVSRSAALKISDSLSLSDEERGELLSIYDIAEKARRGISYELYNQEEVKPLSWLDYTVLSTLKLNLTPDSSAIKNKLSKIEPYLVSNSIEKLLDLGLIRKDQRGGFERNVGNIITTDGVSSCSLQEGHRKNLELAEEALRNTPVHLRDFTGLTMAIDSKKIPLAVSLIRKFQDELSVLLEESDSRDEVYKLCIQLFPLTSSK
jgi:uncharacterized protein (TIGR02147 family)